ncbi:protein of unknown function [Candidatus Nitrosotalea okcheonensis]|uniref:Uncharacterized protein n=1 Tax=Candidatus Nitrosotalea okcheonensis TaxID=1903276 RepID=A0A2H1FD34_9ARCH|nr:protein of unknown function [Candidatus Nitrosotalea okcheonensis]
MPQKTSSVIREEIINKYIVGKKCLKSTKQGFARDTMFGLGMIFSITCHKT